MSAESFRIIPPSSRVCPGSQYIRFAGKSATGTCMCGGSLEEHVYVSRNGVLYTVDDLDDATREAFR